MFRVPPCKTLNNGIRLSVSSPGSELKGEEAARVGLPGRWVDSDKGDIYKYNSNKKFNNCTVFSESTFKAFPDVNTNCSGPRECASTTFS